MNVLKNQAEVERLAEDVLSDKQLIIDLDRRRNENRSALGCFRRNEIDKKAWFFTDGLIMKLGKDSAKEIIEKEQKKLDEEIFTLRNSMKEKMASLEKLERELYPNIPTKAGSVTASTFSTLKPVNPKELMK